jgi:hypothetical protein
MLENDIQTARSAGVQMLGQDNGSWEILRQCSNKYRKRFHSSGRGANDHQIAWLAVLGFYLMHKLQLAHLEFGKIPERREHGSTT